MTRSKVKAETDSAIQANEKIQEFLEEFIKLENSPKSAVLINGPWGSGETFLIKSFIERHKQQHHFYYVSLYGVTSREEFSDAVFFAAYPALNNKLVNITGSVLSSILKFVRVESDITLKTILEKTEPGVYVFDDLERSGIPICNLLGYINDFVEHAGCRVIILTNEDELTGHGDDEAKSEYRRRKEKTIGWTLAVHCEAEAGLTSFLDGVSSDQSKEILHGAKDRLLIAFQKSESENLRLLQQAVWDLERAIPKVKEAYRANEVFNIFIGITAALAIEIRRGTITRNDLKDPGPSQMASLLRRESKDVKETAIEKFSKRHPDISLYDLFVSSDAIHDWLFDGQINEKSLNAAFELDPRFRTPDQVPSWQVAWNWFRNTHAAVLAAVDDMKARLAKFEYRKHGEILHVFGILIEFADFRVLNATVDDALKNGKQYVDELLARGELEREVGEFGRTDGFRSYEHLGFSGRDRPQFQELANHLRARAYEASVSDAERNIPQLLDLMESAPDDFVRRLCPVPTNFGTLCRIPILAKIAVAEFAGRILSLPPHIMIEVASVFSNRYQFSNSADELSTERAWLTDLRHALEQRRLGCPYFTSKQIQFVIDNIDKGIKLLSRAKVEDADNRTKDGE